MEPMGAFPEGEWDFYSRIFSMEEPDFAAEVFGQCSFPLEHFEGSECTNPSVFCSDPESNYASAAAGDESLLHCGNTSNSNLLITSQDNATNNNSCSTKVLIPTSCHESYFSSDFNWAIPVSSDMSMSMDFSVVDEKGTGLVWQRFADIPAYVNDPRVGNDDLENSNHAQPASCAAPGKDVQLKRKFHASEPKTNKSNHAKKRPRIASDVQKSKKSEKSKRNSKPITPSSGNDEEEINAGLEGQSLSSYSSEDDNTSQDSNGGASSESKASEALNSSGKARASRGSATDPQSLYARKRRERINERLRILQNLVPNGTKVDISTMLEEAVHYVKFLQLQIKLLSSDDLWMFAPIAYNGIDVGLNQRISMLV